MQTRRLSEPQSGGAVVSRNQREAHPVGVATARIGQRPSSFYNSLRRIGSCPGTMQSRPPVPTKAMTLWQLSYQS